MASVPVRQREKTQQQKEKQVDQQQDKYKVEVDQDGRFKLTEKYKRIVAAIEKKHGKNAPVNGDNSIPSQQPWL